MRWALADSRAAVLVAPPGAGKTTRVPLALLDEPWAKREASCSSRAASPPAPPRPHGAPSARRSARRSGCACGSTKVVSKTRIEVVTEGVFTRMILADPALDGVAAVLFDEFHERSLDADLGLALRSTRSGLREDLRLLVMSATLDGARVRATSRRRAGDRERRAAPSRSRRAISAAARRAHRGAGARAVTLSRSRDAGSVLAFLPGQGEIRRVAERLAASASRTRTSTSRRSTARSTPRAGPRASRRRRRAAQDRARDLDRRDLAHDRRRARRRRRGLTAFPVYEPDAGLTRLETVRVSAGLRRSAPRARRAHEAGICYRLWEEAENGGLRPFAAPEILSADLSGLRARLRGVGRRRACKLVWLNSPPRPR